MSNDHNLQHYLLPEIDNTMYFKAEANSIHCPKLTDILTISQLNDHDHMPRLISYGGQKVNFLPLLGWKLDNKPQHLQSQSQNLA